MKRHQKRQKSFTRGFLSYERKHFIAKVQWKYLLYPSEQNGRIPRCDILKTNHFIKIVLSDIRMLTMQIQVY